MRLRPTKAPLVAETATTLARLAHFIEGIEDGVINVPTSEASAGQVSTGGRSRSAKGHKQIKLLLPTTMQRNTRFAAHGMVSEAVHGPSSSNQPSKMVAEPKWINLLHGRSKKYANQ